MELDDIQSMLNPTRAMDLRHALMYTPPRLRPAVALAFTELNVVQLANLTDLPRSSITEWLTRSARLPFGAAVRMARVFGVPPAELFEEWI